MILTVGKTVSVTFSDLLIKPDNFAEAMTEFESRAEADLVPTLLPVRLCAAS